MFRESMTRKFFVCVMVLGLYLIPSPVIAADATITVDTTVDSNAPAYQACTAAPADCSLRGAISKANADITNSYTILVPAGVYTLTLEGAEENENATGDLDIIASLTLQGAGMGVSIIQAGPSADIAIDRVLEIPGGSFTVQISRLTFRHGIIQEDRHGAGLKLNGGSVVLTQVAIVDNLGLGYSSGGGLLVNAYVSVYDSLISGNITSGEGGGIYQVGESLLVERSLIANNSAMYGGGLANQGTTTLRNVTISGNTATQSGGGVSQWNAGDLTIYHTTIANNIVTGMGVNSGWAINDSRVFNAYNSIIIAIPGKQACTQSIDAGNNSISTDSSCGVDLVVADAMLGPLQDNGGYSWTQALLAGSPAIDAADIANCPAVDQRWISRPIDGNQDGSAGCDIGAFEKEMEVYLPLVAR